METQVARVAEGNRGSAVGLEPETILPSQYFERFQIDASLQPEKRLMLAVLEDAVGTFQKYAIATGRRARRLFAEAEEWFASEDVSWPYAVLNICQALGLEPAYVRRGLMHWRSGQVEDARHPGNVIRFPFRRVNGRRHSITGRPVGLRRSA
jgi:hypothetical protein